MNSPLRRHNITTTNRMGRVLWNLVWLCLFRPSPIFLHGWRRFLLRVFGADIKQGAHIYPSVRVWAPWNLEVGPNSCLGHFVDCYCVEKVTLGKSVIVSQYAHLCTASHDYNSERLPLLAGAIAIDSYAWVTSGVFIGPGVTVGEGAVIGARSSVFKDVDPWVVVVGNPPKMLKRRKRAEKIHQVDS